MKILVPVDFSPQSETALQYAYAIAQKMKAELLVLHVAYLDAPPKASATLRSGKILEIMMANAETKMNTLLAGLNQVQGRKVKTSSLLLEGYPIDEVINSVIAENRVELLVMGTKGASGLKKILMGSVAATVISTCTVPVITVPEKSAYKRMKHIVYASDFNSVSKELQALSYFAAMFNATIHVLHVIPADSKKKIDPAKVKDSLVNKLKYPRVTVKVQQSNDVKQSIDEYIAAVGADLLVMFTHRNSFLEKLFNSSQTRKMAFHTHVPLLSVNKHY